MNSFYTNTELDKMGLKHYGKNVLISRKASIYSADKISIGNDVRIDDFCILSGHIEIGSYVHVAAFSALYGGESGIFVHDYANISSRVSIYSVSDDYSGLTMTNPMIPEAYKNIDNRPVVIDKHVIIGSTSVVMPGVIAAEGCSFGAFSFVNKSTDPWGMYVGVPVKRVKERKKDLLKLVDQFVEKQTIAMGDKNE